MKRITLRLPAKTLESITSQALAEGRTPADLARHHLNLAFEVPDAPKLNKRQNPTFKGI